MKASGEQIKILVYHEESPSYTTRGERVHIFTGLYWEYKGPEALTWTSFYLYYDTSTRLSKDYLFMLDCVDVALESVGGCSFEETQNLLLLLQVKSNSKYQSRFLPWHTSTMFCL